LRQNAARVAAICPVEYLGVVLGKAARVPGKEIVALPSLDFRIAGK
jgi:hypothetical protein